MSSIGQKFITFQQTLSQLNIAIFPQKQNFILQHWIDNIFTRSVALKLLNKLCSGVKPNPSGISYSSLCFFLFKSEKKNKQGTSTCTRVAISASSRYPRDSDRLSIEENVRVEHLTENYQCMFVRTLHYFVEAKRKLLLRWNCSLCVGSSLQSVSRLNLFLTMRLVVYRKACAFGLFLFLAEVDYTVC